MHKQIHRYVNEREAGGVLCSRSAAGTRSKLRSFHQRWPNLEPSKIRRRHVEKWMAQPGLSPAYRRGRLSAMRGFCRWLVDRGVLETDPTHGIAAPRQPRYAPRNLTRSEVQATLRCADDARTALTILLMVQQGLRRIEVARAQVGDIDWHRGTIAIRGKGSHGHVSRTLPLADETRTALETYLAEHPHGAGPLLRSYIHPERGVSAAHLSALVSRAMSRAGITGKTPHGFRHSCAVDVLDECGDITVVQQVLGHVTVRSTECYTAGRVSHLRDAVLGRSYATP